MSSRQQRGNGRNTVQGNVPRSQENNRNPPQRNNRRSQEPNRNPRQGNRHRSNHSNQSKPVIYQRGISGWRKRGFYFLTLFIGVIAIVDLALIVWIIRVMDFGLHGMGKLHITNNGIRMDGVAEFVSILRAKTLSSRRNAPIQINSRKNISLSAIDSKGNVVGQISMDEKKIVLKNKKLYIQDVNGRTMLYADDQKIRMDIQNMHITVPGGLNLENSVQTSQVESTGHGEGLTLESLSKKLFINAASGDVNVNSYGSSVRFSSYQNMQFLSKKGKIILDSKNVQLRNLPQSSPATPNNVNTYNDIAELCVCKDGTLFLAPPDHNIRCKVTNGVCV